MPFVDFDSMAPLIAKTDHGLYMATAAIILAPEGTNIPKSNFFFNQDTIEQAKLLEALPVTLNYLLMVANLLHKPQSWCDSVAHAAVAGPEAWQAFIEEPSASDVRLAGFAVASVDFGNPSEWESAKAKAPPILMDCLMANKHCPRELKKGYNPSDEAEYNKMLSQYGDLSDPETTVRLASALDNDKSNARDALTHELCRRADLTTNMAVKLDSLLPLIRHCDAKELYAHPKHQELVKLSQVPSHTNSAEYLVVSPAASPDAIKIILEEVTSAKNPDKPTIASVLNHPNVPRAEVKKALQGTDYNLLSLLAAFQTPTGAAAATRLLTGVGLSHLTIYPVLTNPHASSELIQECIEKRHQGHWLRRAGLVAVACTNPNYDAATALKEISAVRAEGPRDHERIPALLSLPLLHGMAVPVSYSRELKENPAARLFDKNAPSFRIEPLLHDKDPLVAALAAVHPSVSFDEASDHFNEERLKSIRRIRSAAGLGAVKKVAGKSHLPKATLNEVLTI